MTSIKVKFRPSADAEREGAIYYQIKIGRASCRERVEVAVVAG